MSTYYFFPLILQLTFFHSFTSPPLIQTNNEESYYFLLNYIYLYILIYTFSSDVNRRPVTSEAFRPNKSRGGSRPRTGHNHHGNPNKPSTPYNMHSEPRVRYVTTPQPDNSQRKWSITDVLNGRDQAVTWNPQQSTTHAK